MAAAEHPLARIELKLPPELKERAREAAKASRRSLNREVQVALEHHLKISTERETR
jgi:predicted HicB family RNase H-like nuclease